MSQSLGAGEMESQLGVAAVVGLGAVTAFGWSVDALRAGLLSGLSTVAKPALLDTSGHRTDLASEVSLEPGEVVSDRPQAHGSVDWARLSRADQFAVAAAQEAWCDAGAADWADPTRTGVFFGGSTAGMAEAEHFFRATLESAEPNGELCNEVTFRRRLRSLESQQLNGPGDAVARALEIAGPVVSMSSACASGALAIEAALEALRNGEVDVAVAGGSDSLCQMTYAGFNSLRAVDAEQSRPFRIDRAGLNLGEGAGVMILVRAETARAANPGCANAIAWLRGAGASCDAHHMTAPHPEGDGAAASMRAALADGVLGADQVSFVNAHGTGTPHNDSAEAAAIETVFGDSMPSTSLPVTSAKGAVGHLLGAAGAVEAVATVLALSGSSVQPTAQTPCSAQSCEETERGIDLVRGEPRELPRNGERVGVSNSFAFGGANASLVFSTLPVSESQS